MPTVKIELETDLYEDLRKIAKEPPNRRTLPNQVVIWLENIRDQYRASYSEQRMPKPSSLSSDVPNNIQTTTSFKVWSDLTQAERDQVEEKHRRDLANFRGNAKLGHV